MSGPSGNQLVLFSLESRCFPRLRLGKHQDSWENKTNCFPRDLTLSVYYFPGDHSFVFQSVHQRQSGNEQVSRSSYSGLCNSGRYITLIFAYSLISKICLSYWFVLLSRHLDVGSNVKLKK